jgi:RNA polymerase sigma-70 factor (ECF subfamily)
MATCQQTELDQAERQRFLPTRRSLLSRLRNLDDHTSWRDFFDTYWKLIYSAAVKAGLSDAEAQDVVQETVLTVSRKIQEFKYDPAAGSFKGWLLHTTRWRVLDHLRKRGPEARNRPLISGGGVLGEVEEIADPVASARIDAVWEAEWEQNLMDSAIQRIKRRVKPKHYQVFELYAIKGWSALKVARTLGVNVAQVHLVKHRVGNMVKMFSVRASAFS